MSQPPSDKPAYGFAEDPPGPKAEGGKSPGRALSEAEVKKALADQLMRSNREQAKRQAERDAIPPRQRTGAWWVEHGRLIASGMGAVLALVGVGVCYYLNLALPFYIVPGLLLAAALIGFVFTWFGLNE